MKFRIRVLLFLLTTSAVFATGCGATHEAGGFILPKMSLADEVREAFNAPIDGVQEQAGGFYSEGSLSHPVSIDNSGFGYVRVFISRDASWTTQDMAQIIKRAAAEVALRFPNREPVQLGDLSGPHGGQLLGHASHQNGLDADIRFLSRRGHLQRPAAIGTGFDESYVKAGKLTGDFDLPRNWALIKSIASTRRVARIFVDGAVKRGLCEYAKSVGDEASQADTLRRLRPYPNHDDHMHLRITCPRNSPHCQGQREDDMAPTTGC